MIQVMGRLYHGVEPACSAGSSVVAVGTAAAGSVAAGSEAAGSEAVFESVGPLLVMSCPHVGGSAPCRTPGRSIGAVPVVTTSRDDVRQVVGGGADGGADGGGVGGADGGGVGCGGPGVGAPAVGGTP